MSKLSTPKWVRNLVRWRDKKCRHCGTKGSKKNPLTVHHIRPKRTHPHLVADPFNCILLCWDCHKEVHNQGG